MYLALAAISFGIFAVNVAAGAYWSKPFMSNLGELACLAVAAACFVVAIQQAEARRNGRHEGH